MKIKEDNIKEILNNISSIKYNKEMYNYVEKMLLFFKDDICEYSENVVRAYKYGESFDLHIDYQKKSFDLAITSWNSVNYYRFVFKTIENDSVFRYRKSIVYYDGIEIWDYHYIYFLDKLVYVDGKHDSLKNISTDKMKEDTSQTCFYIDGNKVYKKENNDKYSIVVRDDLNFKNMNFVDFNLLNNKPISNEDFKKIENKYDKVRILSKFSDY